MFGKLAAGLVGGVLAAGFGLPFAGMVLSGAGVSLAPYVMVLGLLVIAATMLLALLARSPPKAWRYALIAAGSLALALSTAHYLHLGFTPPATAAVGQAAGSEFVALMAFFVGVVLLLIGLLVGREKS